MAVAFPPLTVERIPAAQLCAADVDAWAEIQASDPALASPLLSPWFAQVVGQVREDARIAVFRRDDRALAFFPHHRRPGGFGRPIGAPFSDYHGVVSAPGAFDPSDNIVALAGLKAFRHNGLIDPHGLFPETERLHDAHSIELDGTPEAYLEAARAASPKKFKNWRRLQHRLADVGPLRLTADRSDEAFDRLLTWKSEQFQRTGAQDVLRPAWAREMMHRLFHLRQGPMTGLMLTLYAGDTLVGGHFGVSLGGVFHPWIASMAPDMAAFSPGQTFLDQAIRAMPGLGLRVYDLGVGHDHYKRPFAATVKTVGGGLQSVPGKAGALSRAGDRAWQVGALGRSGAVDKVRRRLDHIATADPSIRGRVHGLLEAVQATRRRSVFTED